jgi:sialate O-acetylesterase
MKTAIRRNHATGSPVTRCVGGLFLLLVMGSISRLHAEVKLPHILSDHAVLQRDAPIHLWGWADPGERVEAAFHAQERSTAANEYGEWSLWLAPEPAGGPFALTIHGTTGAPITFTDILVGDVWFASGQSNMEMPLRGFPGSAVVKNAAAEIAAATLPQVRLLVVEKKPTAAPQQDLNGTWTTCTPATAAEFSAVAYFFGRAIQQQERVPIGLIDSTWGGTPVEAWTSLDAISSDAGLMPEIALWAHFADQQTRLPAIVAAEQRADAAALAAHQPRPSHPWHPYADSWQPAALYNGMIAPATPYTIKGFLWYQGESNSAVERAPYYSRFFSAMIADWRNQWHEGDLPFLFAQISSFNSPGERYGQIRDQQRRTLAVANTAMAVTLDVGTPDNVHPPDKQTVGARLALAAEATVYHRSEGGKPIEFSGPLFREVTREDAKLRVWFDHAGGGLHTKGAELLGFEVAGKDGSFVPAQAAIDGTTVVVSSTQVPDPVSVRYAWPSATPANLFNSAELPASTFTSE